MILLLACAPAVLPGDASPAARITRGGALNGWGGAGVGDLDGDGRGDVALQNQEYVQIYLGTSGGLGAVAASVSVGTGALDGTIAPIGDFDGDGRPDFVVGDPGFEADGVDVGRALVLGPSDDVASPIDDLVGALSSACTVEPELGAVVAGIGDRTGDGRADVLVAARNWTTCESGSFYASTAWIWSSDGTSVVLDAADGPRLVTAAAAGPSGLLLAGTEADDPVLWTWDGALAAARPADGVTFGEIVSADVDGDGVPEWIVGVRSPDGTGQALVLDAALAERARVPSEPMFGLGGRLASVGDVNGDGFDDVAFGTSAWPEPDVRAWLYYGGPGGLSATGVPLDVTLAGGRDWRVAAAGDVDADGFADVLVSGHDSEVTDIFYGGDDPDADGDGVAASVDCDDADAAASGPAFYPDEDGDGFGRVGVAPAGCEPGPGIVADRTDCDDARADVNPSVQEVCDPASTDEDCDGRAEEHDSSLDLGTRTRWRHDVDGDGFGTSLWAIACHHEGVANDLDCDDDDPDVHPGAAEACGSIDRDCDGATVACDAPPDGCSCGVTYVTPWFSLLLVAAGTRRARRA